MLNYWHFAQSGGYSLDPRDSDSYLNFVLMYQIVGTLLKNSNDGIYEPYLAESWLVSDDRLKYTFKFRKNLVTSKGKIINASEYSKVFHFLSRYLSSGDGGLVQFDRIVGMKDFLNGNLTSISGLSVDEKENSISFLFMEPPDDVLIAFTEPYFGFYNLEDFTQNGLRSSLDLDCSGYFEISNITSDRRLVKISRRMSFEKQSNPVYNEIILHLFNGSEFESGSPGESHLIYGAPEISSDWKDKYLFTTSDPNMLGALVLSPFLKPFTKPINREIIRDQIHKYKNDFKLLSPRGQSSKYFNFLSQPSVDFLQNKAQNNSENLTAIKNKDIIDVAYFNLLSSEVAWINLILEKASAGLNFQLKLKQVDRSIPGEMTKVGSDRSYQARFVTVVVGGSASNQNNKMMFCSGLGVNFKDPSGRICELVNHYESISGVLDQEYVDKFNRIMWEDSVIIPMFHLGFYWMHTLNVNPNVLRFGMGMPRLDLIEYND